MQSEEKWTRVATGLVFGESVRWHDERVWCCDWGTGEVLSFDPNGGRTVVASFSSFPLCIDWLPDGRLLAVAGGDGRVVRQERDGSLVTHADLGGLSIGRWNEIVVAADGTTFVNGGDDAIVSITSDGKVREVARDVAFPNGMALNLSGDVLIVAESHANQLTAFDLGDDGLLLNRRVWAHVGEGAPDGITVDATGAIWYADVPNRCCVRVREGGEILARVDVDRGCFSCALGGPDETLLYIAATNWRGFEKAFEGPASGVLFVVDVGTAT